MQMASPISDKERSMMRHALGLDQSEKAYRNHYVAPNDSDAMRSWRKLVNLGLARETYEMPWGMTFALTDEGKQRALQVV